MPSEGLPWLPSESYLSAGQIVHIAQTFLKMGGSKVRLTGGEPLLRDDILEIISLLLRLEGIESLGMTTNGSLLGEYAQDLWDVGLRRINVSLDSLNPCRFRWVCLSDQFSKVQMGLDKVFAIGFKVKINTVVLKGITHADVDSLLDLAAHHDLEVRFIEFMPLCGTGWKPDLCFPIDTVKKWVESRFDLIPITRGSAPAESFHLSGGRGRVGFIASLSAPFCESCTRIRLSADGKIYPCLFSKVGYNLVPYLNDEQQLRLQLSHAVFGKPKGHETIPLETWRSEEMPYIRSIGG